MFGFAVLGSGSKGNCVYIETEDNSFLIDAGLSRKQIQLRLAMIKKDISNIGTVLITHEHTDHIRGLEVLYKNISPKVYVNRQSFSTGRIKVSEDDAYFFSAGDEIRIKDTRIRSIKTSHDSISSCGFIVSHKGKSLGVITDTGYVTAQIKKEIKGLNALVLESNHDIDMLIRGPYPAMLKKRISSKTGHLSNYDAASLILDEAGPKMKSLFLAHLSQENNNPALALETFKKILSRRKDLNLDIRAAKQESPTGFVRV